MLAVMLALKLADVVAGRVANTAGRHLLRLAPEAEFRHKSNEFDYVFRTNKLGLRGPDIPFLKPPGMFRVVVLGDSFVAGYGVADEFLLTRLLEDDIAANRRPQEAPEKIPPRVEVVNIGRVGTSTIRELNLYEAIGRRFQPDL